MAVLGERAGARFDRVAIAHSIRILMVVSTVPLALTWSGASGSDIYEPVARHFSIPGMFSMALLMFVGGLLFTKFGIANAWLLGPLIISILLTFNNINLTSIPSLLVVIGQILIGWALGSRCEPSLRNESRLFLLGVIASSALTIVLSLLLGLAISRWHNIPIPSMVLVTAPGGISEMSITAKILKLGVPLVTAFQVTRLSILLTVTFPLWRQCRYLIASYRR